MGSTQNDEAAPGVEPGAKFHWPLFALLLAMESKGIYKVLHPPEHADITDAFFWGGFFVALPLAGMLLIVGNKLWGMKYDQFS